MAVFGVGQARRSGVLGDKVMAVAHIDQPAHLCHIVNIRGNSYRMRDHQNPLQSGSDRCS